MKQDNTFSLIAKLNNHMQNFLQAELKAAGMEGVAPSHGKIIMCLFGTEGLTMKELSSKINKTPQTVTTLVGKLEQKGYVTTQPSKEDGRVTMVALTEKGAACKPAFMEISGTLYQKQYGTMSQEDIHQLRTLLAYMILQFEG